MGICGKSQGARFPNSRTQKAPLFPTTWAHQARYVRRRELTRQPGPRSAREGSSYVAVPGAWGRGGGGGGGDCVMPLVIFRALSMLRGVTHRSSAHVAGEPDGLYSWQRQERDAEAGFARLLSLPAGPLSSSPGFTFPRSPQGGHSPAGSPGSRRSADLHPSCAYLYVGWGDRWLHPSC